MYPELRTQGSLAAVFLCSSEMEDDAYEGREAYPDDGMNLLCLWDESGQRYETKGEDHCPKVQRADGDTL